MSWLDRLKTGLKKSSEKLDISGIFTRKKLDQETLDELEEALIMADLGVNSAAQIINDLAKEKFDKEISSDEIKQFLADKISTIITESTKGHDNIKTIANDGHNNKLRIFLMVGVNGSGKTTTIGKLAKKFADSGKKVKVAACDTFRAAAIEQIKVWADRANVEILSTDPGSDAAALAYKAVEESINDGTDIIFIDTAGRLQNKSHLMEELSKMNRVIEKAIKSSGVDNANDTAVDINTLLVLDATTGQNALSQVELFKESVGVSGLVMTKLDGSAKGGVLVNIVKTHHLPVYYIGVGESEKDLMEFNANDFANNLVGIETNE